jgi:DtxR family transcriptional regulator, Mn-dependent transcriptional regulator
MGKRIVSGTAEDYLKALLRFEDMNEKVSTSKVARHLEVTDATVTDMLRKLQASGLLEYTPYYGASLTPRGRAIALKILRRHRLLELFLHQIMGYGWEQVHEEAEKLEHAVSDFFVARVDALLNYPVKDPHGEVIPDSKGFREAENDLCLAEATVGDYIIRRVTDSNPELLTYLEKEGLLPTRSFSLVERAPFQGPLKLLLTGRNSATYIGLDVAKRIFASSRDARGNSSLLARKPSNSSPPEKTARAKTTRSTMKPRLKKSGK